MKNRFKRYLTVRILDAFLNEWHTVRVELKPWEKPMFDGEIVNLERERLKRQVGMRGEDWKPI